MLISGTLNSKSRLKSIDLDQKYGFLHPPVESKNPIYFSIMFIIGTFSDSKALNGNSLTFSHRSFVDAGELLLPTFGYCDVLEEWVDIKHSVVNEHKLLCEISQHILYQVGLNKPK